MESLPAGPRSMIDSSIEAFNLFKRGPAEIPAGTPTNSSPTFNSTIIDFVPPPRHGPLRVRRAAHLVDAEYLEKYDKAVELMRALPADDPRSLTQQANVYRAYGDGAFDQIGFPKLDLHVNNSWFFFPWHRFYLYFYERILGKLIGDDNFSVPFWNWDHPDGMVMPDYYTKKSTFLYNKDQPTIIIDHDDNTNPNLNELEVIEENLKIMHRHMILNGKTPELFLGAPYRAGDEHSPGSGSIEQIRHRQVHAWIRNSSNSNTEDMGNFYSSGRDIFFNGFHCNIDRLWSVWKTLGDRRRDFDDAEWLHAYFYFYDEKAQLVRVKVRDCLDTNKLGYTYEEREIPWLNKRPTPMAGTMKKKAPAVNEEAVFPITLNKPVSVTVKRTKRGRTKKEEEDEEEVLLVEDIEVGRHESAKFDVYINLPEEERVRPSASEFAGSFTILPDKQWHGQNVKDLKTNLRLGITDLLEDIGAEEDDSVVVTLLPRTGNGNNVKVGRLRIVYSS